MRRLAALALLLSSCGPFAGVPAGTSTTALVRCDPTIAIGHRPPDEVLDFFRRGMMPPMSAADYVAQGERANWAGWAGNAWFWASLPESGEIHPSFPPAHDAGWKVPSYATAPQVISPGGDRLSYPVGASARRLDGPTPAGFVASMGGGYGPGFLATSLTFPSPGCWEVTYRAPAGSFAFIFDVR